jgi:hypothetical protein
MIWLNRQSSFSNLLDISFPELVLSVGIIFYLLILFLLLYCYIKIQIKKINFFYSKLLFILLKLTKNFWLIFFNIFINLNTFFCRIFFNVYKNTVQFFILVALAPVIIQEDITTTSKNSNETGEESLYFYNSLTFNEVCGVIGFVITVVILGSLLYTTFGSNGGFSSSMDITNVGPKVVENLITSENSESLVTIATDSIVNSTMNSTKNPLVDANIDNITNSSSMDITNVGPKVVENLITSENSESLVTIAIDSIVNSTINSTKNPLVDANIDNITNLNLSITNNSQLTLMEQVKCNLKLAMDYWIDKLKNIPGIKEFNSTYDARYLHFKNKIIDNFFIIFNDKQIKLKNHLNNIFHSHGDNMQLLSYKEKFLKYLNDFALGIRPNDLGVIDSSKKIKYYSHMQDFFIKFSLKSKISNPMADLKNQTVIFENFIFNYTKYVKELRNREGIDQEFLSKHEELLKHLLQLHKKHFNQKNYLEYWNEPNFIGNDLLLDKFIESRDLAYVKFAQIAYDHDKTISLDEDLENFLTFFLEDIDYKTGELGFLLYRNPDYFTFFINFLYESFDLFL